MSRSALKIAARRAGRLERSAKGGDWENSRSRKWTKVADFTKTIYTSCSETVPIGQRTHRSARGLAENYHACWEFTKISISSRRKCKALGPDCHCIVCAWTKYVIIQRSFWLYKYVTQIRAYICVFTAMGQKRWRDLVTLHVWQLAAG